MLHDRRNVPNHNVLPTCTALVASSNCGRPGSFTSAVILRVCGSSRTVAQPWGPARLCGLRNCPVTRIAPSGVQRRLSGLKSTLTLDRPPSPDRGTR